MGITVTGKINNVQVTNGYVRLNHITGTAKKWNALLIVAESHQDANANKFIYMDNVTVENTDTPYVGLYEVAKEKLKLLGFVLNDEAEIVQNDVPVKKSRKVK